MQHKNLFLLTLLTLWLVTAVPTPTIIAQSGAPAVASPQAAHAANQPLPVAKSTANAQTDRANSHETTRPQTEASPLTTNPGIFASQTEGFESVAALPGLGWTAINNSAPIGIESWFQGNSGIFPAHSGDAASYLAVNFQSAAGLGDISNWLLTPELILNDGDIISFWTRTVMSPTLYPDRLELRMSLNGASADVGGTTASVGDFTTLLLTVNPDLTTIGYPNVWTEYTATLSGIGSPTNGRLAFRYFVPNGGPLGDNSDYIGIDSFTYSEVYLYRWNGSVNGDWDHAANWTPSGPPTSSSHVVIDPANLTGASFYPVLEVDPIVDNLTLAAGAELTIPDGRTLTVNGSLTNNGLLRQTIDNVTAPTTFLGMGGYGGVEINPAGDMGLTTVEIRGNQDCTTDNSSQAVQRCFDITPTTPLSATIHFYYAPGEANGNLENAVSVYHWNGAGWDLENGIHTHSDGADPRWVQVTGVSSYSPFVLDNQTPTAVTLQSFTAVPTIPMALVGAGLALLALMSGWLLRRRIA